MAHSFLPADLAQLEARGISVEKAEKQLQSFATGFPELDIVSAASVGNGVLNPSEEEIDAYVKAWQEYLDEGHTVLKFVPASGAASRMFKNLFEYLEDGKKTDFIDKFLSEKDRFAFGPQLAGMEEQAVNGKWKLDNYVERSIGEMETMTRGKSKDTTLMLKPRDLYNIKEEFEEMNLFEIHDHIQNLELKGADNTLPPNTLVSITFFILS